MRTNSRRPQIQDKAKPLHLLQVLRGVAAIMVVILHATTLETERFGSKQEMWWSGAAGVDIFFVISGFVMALSSRSITRRSSPGREFMKRRLERIVPLYWLFTTLKIVLVLAFPGVALRELGGSWHILSSYLFIPSNTPTLEVLPVLSVGWTLNFEMMFYALFAIALALKVRPIRLLAPILILLAFLPTMVNTSSYAVFSWASPIVLEFLFGMMLYEAWQRRMLLPPVLSWIGLLAGLCALQYIPWGWMSPLRPFVWGLPALAILAAAVSLERPLGQKARSWMLEIGDASYSIYLTHAFTLPVLAKMLLHVPVPQLRRTWPVILMSVVTSVAMGILVYRLVELPIINYFRRKRSIAA